MEEVKQDYLDSLKGLTFNSRPLIHGLTEIAAECKEYGKGVADAIEQHLSTCQPPFKIPILYLTDSILKNVGEPYVDLFAAKVYRMVTESYRHLPPPQKQKLIDLFKSWTVPQPKTGQPVFSANILDQIEHFFINATNANNQQQSQNQQKRLNQSSVQVEINRMLTYLGTISKDKETEYQISTLQRLQSHLSSSSADQATLVQAHQQVEEFRSRQENAIKKRQNHSGGDRDSKRKRRGNDRNSDGPGTGSNATPLPSAFPDLLSSLKTSGIFDEKPAAAQVLVTVELSNASLAQPRLQLVDQLYKVMPIQCSVCGKRFPNTAEGRAAKQEELDRHFRVNNDIRQGRSHSRMWLLTAQQWANSDDDNAGQGSAQNEEPAVDFEAEAQKFLAIPEDHDGTCLVCGEKFNTVWNEEAEEWVYQNAVEVEDRVFHATCYADPNNKTAIESILSDAAKND